MEVSISLCIHSKYIYIERALLAVSLSHHFGILAHLRANALVWLMSAFIDACDCSSSFLSPFAFSRSATKQNKTTSNAPKRWSHTCVCPTWKSYTSRRDELSSFPYFDEWHLPLLTRECQISEKAHEIHFCDGLGVLKSNDDKGREQEDERGVWWNTEIHGWSGGLGGSARHVDASVRRNYEHGFGLCHDSDNGMIPLERKVTEEDISQCCHGKDGKENTVLKRDECGLLNLESWKIYYKLRGISLKSPVALLLSYPLTVYYAIQKYGAVPVTVSRMLRRHMRVHVVGVEKEMNFLDLFKEVGYLLPEDLNVELTFVVRKDMLPPKCRTHSTHNNRGYSMRLNLTNNLTLLIVSGTYGASLDPNFDCGSGPPDMIVGMNAGLYAYESWRSVVAYLDSNQGVVGVFTDYNEHSGMNCASLGGGKARDSLCVNPFRQPRAMPVYCMNLPQFSNGFIYVYNEQELDI